MPSFFFAPLSLLLCFSDYTQKRPSTLSRWLKVTYKKLLEAAPRFELGDGGFAVLCLTTWLCRQMENGAEDEIRTRDPRLGKAMLYH